MLVPLTTVLLPRYSKVFASSRFTSQIVTSCIFSENFSFLEVVVDIFKYSDSENLCQISNLNRLLLIVKSRNLLSLEQPISKLLSGNLITPKFINNLLKSFLTPIFLGLKFTTHSFRAAFLSHRATHP